MMHTIKPVSAAWARSHRPSFTLDSAIREVNRAILRAARENCTSVLVPLFHRGATLTEVGEEVRELFAARGFRVSVVIHKGQYQLCFSWQEEENK